jgi:hypothetical protein
VNRSESLAELAAALAKAQGAMRPAAKDHVNPAFPRSKYADLASVWEACREALTANGLSVVQLAAADGNAVTVTTVLLHVSGEWVSEALTLLARDAAPQSVGSAITYARRYGLAAMVGVCPDDDDAEAAMGRGPDARQARPEKAERPGRPLPPAVRRPGAPKELDRRPWPKLLADLVAAGVKDFRADHPDAPEPVNGFQAARHMLKHAIDAGVIADPGKVRDGEVQRILGELYAWEQEGSRPHYLWMRKELKGYLDRKFAESREKATLEEQGDPDLVPAGAGADTPRTREPGEEG